MSESRKKFVKIFIITLVVLQGIYVILPLPDIWPIANYSMFSKSEVSTEASKLEIRGVNDEGQEVRLKIDKHFYPLDRIRLSKGISLILNSEKYNKRKQERIDEAVKYLKYLPVNEDKLRELIYTKIVDEGRFENKEEAMDEIFTYLLAQYQYNGEKSSGADDEYEKLNELKLYRVYWDWTDTRPREVQPSSSLIYSTKTGLVNSE